MTFAATAQESTTIIWQPQPGPQTALLECPVFEVFYGGARGGGKTESSLGDWMQLIGVVVFVIFVGGVYRYVKHFASEKDPVETSVDLKKK